MDQYQTAPAFEERIGEPDFPCVGAKAALAQGGIEFARGGDIRSAGADAQLVARIQAFAADVDPDGLFVSLIVTFPDTPPLSEREFESALWARLQAFSDSDRSGYRWDPEVSSDPESPRFSLSLGGRAFYVIGLHPGSSRPARRFESAALVFNLHSQFEQLREDGRYGKLRGAITQRDVAYSGSANPMMALHGESSEARQYSGRAVGAEWRCPFSPPPAGSQRAH